MAEQVLVPLQEVLRVNGTVLVGWGLDEAAESLVATCHGMDMAVIRDWGNRPSVSPGNAKRVLAHLRGQADPGVRPEPEGEQVRPGLIRSMFAPGRGRPVPGWLGGGDDGGR